MTNNNIDKKIKMDSTKKKLYFISLIFAFVSAFIPTTGLSNKRDLHFGVPAETIEYHGGWIFSFNLLDFLFNFFVFYWVLRLIKQVWGLLSKKK